MWSAEMHGAGMIFKVSKARTTRRSIDVLRLRARLSRVSWAEPNLRGKTREPSTIERVSDAWHLT